MLTVYLVVEETKAAIKCKLTPVKFSLWTLCFIHAHLCQKFKLCQTSEDFTCIILYNVAFITNINDFATCLFILRETPDVG